MTPAAQGSGATGEPFETLPINFDQLRTNPVLRANVVAMGAFREKSFL
jgi:hypothetical protein